MIYKNLIEIAQSELPLDKIYDKVSEFLLAGHNVNEQDRFGSTCVMEFVHFGCYDNKYIYETIKLLVDSGYDKTIRDIYGNSAYDYAVDFEDNCLLDMLRWRE